MMRNSKNRWCVAAALVALSAPAVFLNAQGGGGGRGGGKGGRGAAPVANVPAPTSPPVTGNAAVSGKGAVYAFRLLCLPWLQRETRGGLS